MCLATQESKGSDDNKKDRQAITYVNLRGKCTKEVLDENKYLQRKAQLCGGKLHLMLCT